MKGEKIGLISHERNPIKSGGVTLLNDLRREFKVLEFETVTYLPRISGSVVDENFGSTVFLPMRRNSTSGISKSEIVKYILFNVLSLRKSLVKEEITHVYSLFAFPSGFLTYMSTFGLKMKKTIIVDAIDLPGVKNSPISRNGLTGYVVKKVLKSANRILLIEGLESEFKMFSNQSFEAVKVGICVQEKRIDDDRVNDEFHVITVCRAVQRKRLDLTLRVISETIRAGLNCRLTLIGDGPELDYLKELAVELGIASKVSFPGFLGLDEVGEYMREADCYLFNGENEGISIALLQAMSMSLPVVISKNEGNSALFGFEENQLLIDFENLSSYSSLISKLSKDRDFYNEMSNLCFEISRKYFWENVISSYLPREKGNEDEYCAGSL